MALIKCKECNTEVSSKAETCPKCGARVASKPMGCGTLIGVLFLGVIIISALSSINKNNTPSPQSSSPSIPVAKTTSTPAPLVLGSQWSYSQVADAMSKGTTYHAVALSSNTVEFDFPYAGAQHARLNLRIDPRYGKDIIFSIEKGQILCHSYEDCTVLVRFDDEKAANYSAVGAADNSTETIFIRNYGRFVEKMLKAKQVRISTNIYQQGAPVFEFDVSGFDQSKYKPKK
ncbi:MAG: zinc ribbon domain-containing protein [Methylotenera sp.]|nr:zinc ribbon domain-containing protein [Methylotenera sp.]